MFDFALQRPLSVVAIYEYMDEPIDCGSRVFTAKKLSYA
jgi:hypothetical protein